MNHYPHHIGDYLKDTAHLDPLEDGIYRRMLDLYYTQEGPLDAHIAGLCRRLRVDLRKHGDVVVQLLGEFFQVDEAGTHWHHKRCDSEIAKYQAKADANRRNGKAGGRPKQTDEKPKNNPDGFQDETQTITQKNLNQNQNQNQVKALSGKPDYSPQSQEVLEYLNQLTGRGYRPVRANLDLIAARLKEGFTVDELCAVVQRKTEEWQGKPDMEAYLRPATLFNASKFAQYSGQMGQSTGIRVDA